MLTSKFKKTDKSKSNKNLLNKRPQFINKNKKNDYINALH